MKVKLEALFEISEIFGGNGLEPLTIHEEIDEGTTVRQLFDSLAARYPSFRRVFDPITQELTGEALVMCSGRFLEGVKGLENPLKDGDTVTLLPPLSDG